jgi:hypothetical protein
MQYWAALAFGTSVRTRGQSEEALAALHDALSFAEKAGNAYRRSSALYQLSVLHLALKQGQSRCDQPGRVRGRQGGEQRLRDG